jgi:signal transduction histidine kinase
MTKGMFCARGRGAALLRGERYETMLKRDPERTLVVLEWTVLAAAILANLLGPHMHGSMLLAAIGLGATIAYGVAGLIVVQTLPACIAATLGELVAMAALAALCGRPTYLFLCIVLVARAARRLPRSAALIVGALAVLLPTLPVLSMRGLEPMNLNEALLYAVVVAFVIVAVSALRDLARAHEQLRRSALQLEAAATVAERTRIAHELHDAVGHQLTALNIMLESAIAVAPDDPAHAQTFLADAKAVASEALFEVRRTVGKMDADPLVRGDLAALVAQLAAEMHQRFAVDVVCAIGVVHCSPLLKTALYRVIQEAITNAANTTVSHSKYAIAATAFDPAENRSGHGLRIVRERIESLGGTFAIASARGQGCVVNVSVPAEAT